MLELKPHCLGALLLGLSNISFSQSPQLGGGALQDQANLCLNLGLHASLTGLDNFELRTSGISGSAGAEYIGSDQFHLQSNGRVRVLVDSPDLVNGTFRLNADYQIDSAGDTLVTSSDQVHDQQHTLSARSQLGAISDQLAGQYQTEVTLTVISDYAGGAGCYFEPMFEYPSASYWATMAFEDLYPSPGDADYNDMVVNFRIEEHYNDDQQVESIRMNFVPVARGAGYDHSLRLSLDGEIDGRTNASAQTDPVFTGGAQITTTYTLPDSNRVYSYETRDIGTDLNIFSDTRLAMRGNYFANVSADSSSVTPYWVTQIDITLDNPSANTMGNFTDGTFNYRPYLSVRNTGKEIDIAEINPDNGMIDSNGYPFGIIVPSDWAWPASGVNINDVYPYFEEYRRWLSGEQANLSDEAAEWFNYPASDAGTRIINLDTAYLEDQSNAG